MDKAHSFYPEFDHPAPLLSAFFLCSDVFIISLKNSEIVRFKPDEITLFKECLDKFNVKNIAVSDDIPETNRAAILSKAPNGFNS